MNVNVKLFATLTRFKNGVKSGQAFEVNLPDGAVVQDVIDLLKVPVEEAHIVFINNVIKKIETPLQEGDVVGIFPQIGGG